MAHNAESMMQIMECMSRDVHLTNPNASLQEAAKIMAESDVGALPVGENDRLIGMVTDRDLAVRGLAAGLNPRSATVRDVMSDSISYCYEDDDAEAVALNMAELQVRRLPVLNRGKRLVGMVSLGDVARAVDADLSGRTLQEVSEPQRRLDGD
jgi:CBS domain-containing protein